MILIGFLLVNLTTGITYGSFGPLVTTFAEHFNTRLSLVSLALSLVVLDSGLVAPFVGWLIARFSMRRMMSAGAIMVGSGYVGLSIGQSVIHMLLCFGLLIGPGIALLGPLPCYTLVSNWYRDGQGRAIGLINMPILVIAMPLSVTALLPSIRFETMMLLLAALHILALPLVAMVIDRPDRIGQRQRGGEPMPVKGKALPTSLTIIGLLGDPTFLLMVLASGLIAGPTVSKSVHLFALLREGGVDPGRAALLLSISAGTGVIGSLLFGALADRTNAAIALMTNALIQAVVWLILVMPVYFPLLVVDAMMIGLCAGGFLPLKGVLVGRLYGARNFALVMGASGLGTLPFMFGAAPLAAVLREATGDYKLAIFCHIGGFLIAAACCLAIASRNVGPVSMTDARNGLGDRNQIACKTQLQRGK